MSFHAYSHVGAKVAGQVAVNVASVEDLTPSSARFSVESLVIAAVQGVAIRHGGEDGEVSAGNGVQEQIANLLNGQVLSSKLCQGIPNFGVLVTVSGVSDTQDNCKDDEVLLHVEAACGCR